MLFDWLERKLDDKQMRLLVNFIVGTAFAIIISQALSFGRYRDGDDVGDVGFTLNNHAMLLVIGALALLALSLASERSQRRVRELEKKIEVLSRRDT